MDHPILLALPSLHSTIIGILIAFYSAYFIFSFKELDDAKTKLIRIIRTSVSASTPFSFYDTLPKNDLIDKDDRLDWSKARSLIFKSSYIFNFYQEKFTSKDVVTHVEKLRNIFTIFFTTYPMNGKTINEVIKDEWNKNNETIFNYDRFIEIKDRINILSQLWNHDKESLQALFSIYEKNSDQTNALEHLNEFFAMVKNYESNILPQLNESILNFESSNNRLKVKSNTIIALTITLYILFSGIIFPLILSKNIIVFNWNYNINTAEYTLLFLSFLPYFSIIIFFIYKVFKTEYK